MKILFFYKSFKPAHGIGGVLKYCSVNIFENPLFTRCWEIIGKVCQVPGCKVL